MYNLIFFSLSFLSECNSKKSGEIKVLWNGQRAIGLSFSKNLLKGSDDSINERIAVRLSQERVETAMMGNLRIDGNEIVFEPLVPFTRGLRYELLIDKKKVREILIPPVDPREAPVLLAIYPTQDTLPENLLKIYLQFSKPMREGESVGNILLLRNERDTLRDVFLNLQPELWNEDRSTVTIWLDPGRIKRSLQPNRQLGAPLRAGEHYTLLITDKWKDADGASLTKFYSKKFVTISRDSLSPDPQSWLIQPPTPQTRDALVVDLKTSLDYSLLNSALHVVDEKGKALSGTWKTAEEEKMASFTPDEIWKSGNFQLQIESRLEDLAGNNLNRAFDVDLRAKNKPTSNARVFSRSFKVGNAQ